MNIKKDLKMTPMPADSTSSEKNQLPKKEALDKPKIIMFYGKECPHCHIMLPLADRLAEEEDIEIEKLEVWHNEENAEKMRRYKTEILKACDGVFGTPSFVKSGQAFCGEISYEELKKWAKN